LARNSDLLTYAVIGVVGYYAWTHGWIAKVSEIGEPPKEPAPGEPGAPPPASPGSPPAPPGTPQCPPAYVYDPAQKLCIFPIPTRGNCAYPTVPSVGTAGLVWSLAQCCWQDHGGTCRYGPHGYPVAG